MALPTRIIRIVLLFYCLFIKCAQYEAKDIKLDINWVLKIENSERNIQPIYRVEVPSGVYTELEKHKITESVLFSKNDVELRWIGQSDWTYSFEFQGMRSMQNFYR